MHSARNDGELMWDVRDEICVGPGNGRTHLKPVVHLFPGKLLSTGKKGTISNWSCKGTQKDKVEGQTTIYG